MFPLSNKSDLETKSTPLLSFSVSKNSGRITIHFSDTGESSLTNFDLDQIVTAETSDRLMEARLSRSQNAILSVPLVYDQAVLHRGKTLMRKMPMASVSSFFLVVGLLDKKKIPNSHTVIFIFLSGWIT